ncbi:MAG: acyl-CoA thioesterase [Thiotrichales bacterium]|nr:acyl-CoA thioesterase [Thiotrichales bacterium]
MKTLKLSIQIVVYRQKIVLPAFLWFNLCRHKTLTGLRQRMKSYAETYLIQTDDLDFLGHVNNKRYLEWMERLAWAHAEAVGISPALQKRLNRIFAVREHQMHYLASGYLGQTLELKTWIGVREGCCQRTRYFEFKRLEDETIIFRAQSRYVCITLDTHLPKKIPKEFIAPYDETPTLAQSNHAGNKGTSSAFY